MKKRSTKLSLSKETLAHLGNRPLEAAAGGDSFNPTFQGNSMGVASCQCTANSYPDGSCACGGTTACFTAETCPGTTN
jgi:hypothetical protein